MVFSLETSSSRYSSSVTIHRIGGTPVSQGVDYMLFAKRDFEALPFPDVTELPAATGATIRSLAHRLQHDARKP